MKKFGFIPFLLLLIATLAHAKFDPAFTWSTIETPHFKIHYHQDGEEIARKVAGIAEDVHERLVPRIKWAPKEKTELVLVDSMDEANGMTSVLPYNQMILFLTQPLGEPGFGTTPYEEWMRMLITHEYAHVLQLDMNNGGYGGLFRLLFGRSPFSFPNALQPEWLIEGLATYEETAQTSGGRGRSTGADMVLRMATLQNEFPPLSQMTVFPDTWPSGNIPYLFGASLTQYIADTYGRDKLADLSLKYANRNFPFLVNSTAKRALGDYYGKIYREWKYSLHDKYIGQRDRVTDQGLTSSTALTQKGYETFSPVYSPDGKTIAYFEANNDEFPGIYLMNADGAGDRKITENVFPASASGMKPAWSPDGTKLYYTKEEIVRNTNFYNDIYYYDLRREKEVRVTRDLRARDPHPSPDGKQLLLVTNRMGSTRIALLDLDAVEGRPAELKDLSFLTEESLNQYESPRWSPDGSRIAVAVWQPGGHKDIWVLDAKGTILEKLTDDRALDGAPAWSPDGTYLYFSSDRTGIYNLYAFELESKKIFQVTNVIGGAFSPAPSPDGTNLVYSSYSSRGYDVRTMPVNQSSWKDAEPYQDAYPSVRYEDRAVVTTSRPYTPLPTLAPRFWLPWPGYSKESGTLVGFLTFGQDVIQRHNYLLTGLYGPKTSRFWYGVDYIYDGLYPTIHLQAFDQDDTYSNMLTHATGTYDRHDYVERSKSYGIDMIVPLIRTQKQHAVSLGYHYKDVSGLTKLDPLDVTLPFEGVLASGRISYIFNNARRYGFSISPEQGRTIELGYERYAESIGSDLELNAYTADWHEYISLPWKHHVLQVRAFAGASTGETIPQGAFQLGGDMPGDVTLSVSERAVYLRGYAEAEFRGRKAALLSLEYRLPIINIEHGGGQIPFFWRRLHGAVFAEAGNAWDSGVFHADDAKRAVGAELRLDTDFAYGLVPLTLRLGFARGLDEEGESQVLLSAWLPLGL